MTATPPSPQYAAQLARIVDLLRLGPHTRAEVATAVEVHNIRAYHLLTGLVESGHVTVTTRKTGGRPALVYALAREPKLPPAPVAKTAPPEDRYESTSGTFVLETTPSTTPALCVPARTTTTLAACIDGYVSATARGTSSQCNGCRHGRARRADYAGSDFEEGDDE